MKLKYFGLPRFQEIIKFDENYSIAVEKIEKKLFDHEV